MTQEFPGGPECPGTGHCIPRDLGRDVPQPSCPAQCTLSGASGTGDQLQVLSRVCMMCSPKEMSRPCLGSLSGDMQG